MLNLLTASAAAHRAPALLPLVLLCGLIVPGFSGGPPALAAATPGRIYDVVYDVELAPQADEARVRIALQGGTLPSRLTFTIDPERHRGFKGEGKVEVEGRSVMWYPPRGGGSFYFSFRIDHALESGTFDSLMTDAWAVFRADRLIPPVSVRAVPSVTARTTLQFRLPDGWSVAAPYAENSQRHYVIDNPERRFDRPTGWILAGRIGSRHEKIAGISTVVAAPIGDDIRRQDTLAFLNWNLPHLVTIFPDFPQHLLVVRTGDAMFRGGLSGPASLFLHADRPLISENRTSTLLHELVHVAMGIRGDRESDWIVEGFAEYYSMEILRRSGGISDRRFREAIGRQGDWGRRAPDLFVANSSGAVTARAATILMAADQEIRKATADKASLDNVARLLARERRAVSLEVLQAAATSVAGAPLIALERARLLGSP